METLGNIDDVPEGSVPITEQNIPEITFEVDQYIREPVNNILDFPNECLMETFEHMDDMDLTAPAMACDRFSEIANRTVRLRYANRQFCIPHHDSITPILRWLRSFGSSITSLQTSSSNRLVFYAIGKYCENLTELDIVGKFDSSNSIGLIQIMPKLKKISTHAWNLRSYLLYDACQLEELAIYEYCYYDQDLFDDNLPLLNTLLIKKSAVALLAVTSFLSSNPQLQHLHLESCYCINLQLLADILPQLRSLIIRRYWESWRFLGIVHLLTEAKHLRTVQIVDFTFPFEADDAVQVFIECCNAITALIDERKLNVSIEVNHYCFTEMKRVMKSEMENYSHWMSEWIETPPRHEPRL